MQLIMSFMQQPISIMQQKVHSVNFCMEQSQLDIQECLRHHHPFSSDDEDDAPMAEASRFILCLVFIDFETIYSSFCG
jgi:hypothetical protein